MALTVGSTYGFTSSTDLVSMPGATDYFLQLTGLGFSGSVHADTAPTRVTEYTDPCMDLGPANCQGRRGFPVDDA